MHTLTINIAGYLPDAEPLTFDTAAEAWQYAAQDAEDMHRDAGIWCPGEWSDMRKRTTPWTHTAMNPARNAPHYVYEVTEV